MHSPFSQKSMSKEFLVSMSCTLHVCVWKFFFLGQISRSKLGKCICLIIVDHQSHYEHVYFGNEPHWLEISVFWRRGWWSKIVTTNKIESKETMFFLYSYNKRGNFQGYLSQVIHWLFFLNFNFHSDHLT